MGGMMPLGIFHFTYVEGAMPGGHPLFRCMTCGQEMAANVVSHAKQHGDGQVIIDAFMVLEEHQAREIMKEVRNTSLTYLLLEATDRDDIPAFECADCGEKLTAVGLATHLKVHGAKTYKIDSRRLVSPYLVVIGERFEELRQLITKNYLNSVQRGLAVTNLEQAELWLTKCQEVEHVGYLTAAATSTA